MDRSLSLDEIEGLVKKQACFSALTPIETKALADLFKQVSFKAGTVIVREGDIVDCVYIIISGEAVVQHASVESGEIIYTTIAEIGPGESIGLSDTGFYSLSGVRTATVSAKSEMELLRMNVAAFNGFTMIYPHVGELMRKSRFQSADQ